MKNRAEVEPTEAALPFGLPHSTFRPNGQLLTAVPLCCFRGDVCNAVFVLHVLFVVFVTRRVSIDTIDTFLTARDSNDFEIELLSSVLMDSGGERLNEKREMNKKRAIDGEIPNEVLKLLLPENFASTQNEERIS